MPKSLKKMMPWLILVLLVYFIVRDPRGAATGGHHIASNIAAAAGKIAEFVTSLFAGR